MPVRARLARREEWEPAFGGYGAGESAVEVASARPRRGRDADAEAEDADAEAEAEEVCYAPDVGAVLRWWAGCEVAARSAPCTANACWALPQPDTPRSCCMRRTRCRATRSRGRAPAPPGRTARTAPAPLQTISRRRLTLRRL
jgi:hypothetical protein